MVVTDSTMPGVGEQAQRQHPLIEKLLRIKHEKRSNLCVAADGMTIDETLRLLDTIGPHISILKIHSRQFGPKMAHEELMEKLFEYKKKYNFLLFEDAKFFDGAETVRLDYEAHFAKYVDIVTAVPLGDDILQAIAEGAKNAQLPEDEPRGCLAVCELSFANIIPLESGKYLEVAKRNPNVCIGFIGQKLPKIANMIKATPGINLKSKTDGVNQQWRTPDEIKKDGADIFIVGRGITAAPEAEWASLVLKYKELCYC